MQNVGAVSLMQNFGISTLMNEVAHIVTFALNFIA
jgi:hypothetical protein